MPKDLQFKAALRAWLSGQTQFKDIREASVALGIPFNTLRGYFSGKRPTGKNLKLLIDATGIDPNAGQNLAKSRQSNSKNRKFAAQLLDQLQDDLAQCLASIPTVQDALNDGMPLGKSPAMRKGRQIQRLMDALERNLAVIVNNPEALQLVRKMVSGSDAGYLSGLLGALFDDRRLQTWREMTTYTYGSK